MQRRRLTFALMAGTVVLPGAALAASAVDKAAQALSALTPDNVAARVTLHEDALEADALFSTEPVYQERSGLLRLVTDDSFLRAFVDKRTGAVSWQVYSTVTYNGDWRFFELANYQTSAGVESVPVTVIDRSIIDCGSSSCLNREDVGFDLSDPLIRAVARLYDARGPLAIWRFRLKAKSSLDFTDGFAVAEVAGLVQAVDRWRAAHPLSPAVLSPLPPASAAIVTPPPAVLGVQFAAMPLGALVARVLSGSRAAGAGIVPGMMITYVGGKPLAGLGVAEMQRALAAPGPLKLTIVGKGEVEIS